MKPKISIIIPAYNAGKYIKKAIDSCLAQTYKSVEILVVDDGSQDNTVRVCEEYLDKIILIKKKNGGVSESRNTGIKHATGEYLLFLDADDYLDPDMCEKMIEQMDDDIDLVIGGYHYETVEGKKHTSSIKEIKKYETANFCRLIADLEAYSGYYVCWNKLYKRNKVNLDFPVGMSFAEDSVFVSRYLSRCNRVLVIPYSGYHYCIHSNASAMRRYHLGMFGMLFSEYRELVNVNRDSIEIRSMASRHLFENIIFFAMPQLIRCKSISLKEKILELKTMLNIADYNDAVNDYNPTNKTMAIYKRILGKKLFVAFYMFYMIDELKRKYI